MSPLNQEKVVIEHNDKNRLDFAPDATDAVKVNVAHAADPAQQSRTSVLSPFAAASAAKTSRQAVDKVYVVRTAPAVAHPQIKSTAADNNSQQFTRDHNTSESTAESVVLAQQSVAHYVHSSPVLTTQSYYSGKLITDSNYSETSSATPSAITQGNHNDTTLPSIEQQNELNSSASGSSATVTTDAVQSMDTALSSIFSSTEFFAGWIGGKQKKNCKSDCVLKFVKKSSL